MSFSKSDRKVSHRITPAKVTGERRNTIEVDNTVKTTLHSAWTPTKTGVLNTQLFEERKCLIGHWFEHWTDAQRRQFLEHLVEKFNKMSVYFVHDKIKDQIPAPPADFTTGLPRHLTFKILGHLDPRTLAQSSLVCWHWKWLCEHDVVWKPKCLRRGWDYGGPEPPYERAVWKRFYQRQVWDLLHPPPPPAQHANPGLLDVTEEEDGMLNTSAESAASRRSSGDRKKGKHGTAGKPKTYKLGEPQPLNIGYMRHKQQEMPPWRSSDNKPKDIQLFNKQILGINNETIPRHISDKFTKVEIQRAPLSPRCTSPLPRTKSMEAMRRSKDRTTTPSPTGSPLHSKSLVRERTTSPSTQPLKTSSSFEERTPNRRASNPNFNSKRTQQAGPMPRKHNGLDNKTMRQVAPNRAGANKPSAAKKGTKNRAGPGDSANKSDSGEGVHIPTAWGSVDHHTAKKVASTDTLGSDAALDVESNDSLSIYGDDSGKLSGEAWELQSNLSDN